MSACFCRRHRDLELSKQTGVMVGLSSSGVCIIAGGSIHLLRVCSLLALALTPFGVHAHEGHAPLPSKGVEVDIQRGSVLLTKPARDALGVETAEVTLESGEDRVLAYARLVSPWQQHAFVTSQIPGKITRLHIQPGDTVEAGQTLADIDSPELQNLKLDLINAQNAFVLSGQLVKHFQSIGDGVVAGSKLQEAETDHRKNINDIETARIKLLSLGFTEDWIEQLKNGDKSPLTAPLQLRSPISGTAHHSDLSIGKVVDPTEHLFEVVDLSSVWGKIEVLEHDLQRVAIGQSVEIVLPAYPGETFRSEIVVKEIYLDPESHLGTAWIDLQNPADGPPRLLPGMFGQAQVIIAAPEKLLTVPEAALARDGAERFVLVQEEATDKASQYVKRNVVVVRQSAGKVQFRADRVFPGDRVVTVGRHQLFNFFVQGVLRLSKEASQNISLRTETVGPRNVGDGFAIDGLIELPPAARESVSSQLSGSIEKISITRGQFVRRGTVICELASLEFQDLQLQLVAAENEVVNLETTLKRWEPSRDTQTISQRQRWEMESLFRSKRNLRDNLKRTLETIGLTPQQVDALITEKKFLHSLPLRTTIDGYVVYFDKVIGQFVNAGETIVVVHDLNQVRVRGFVSERELNQVGIGQSARVRLVADAELVAEAVVVRSDQGLDSTNRTLSIWLEFNERPAMTLQHNMLARINLISGQRAPSLAVSLASVVREEGGEYAFVKTADGSFERRLIQTGRSDDRFFEIKSGLAAGETIATWGVPELQSAYAALR